MPGCKGKDDVPGYGGPFLGQSPPGSAPQLFMPGLISTNHINHCIGFLKEGTVCVFSVWEKGVFFMFEKDGRWTEPEQVPWQNEQGPTDFAAGPDGNTVYFQSSRPTSPDDTKQETNMWAVEWTGDGWTDPVPLPSPANTEEYAEIYPSVDQDRSVYYFTFGRPDARDGDIYRSKHVDGKYLEAERLPDPINSDYYEVDPFVAPDGSYLLFGSARPGGFGLMDLYVTFRREDGSWTNPINTGPELNPFCISTRMSVTPDGKYLFFPSRYETDIPKGEDYTSSNVIKWGDYDVYWVSTDFIRELRNTHSGKESAAGMIAEEYEEKGIQSAGALLNELYRTKQDSHYFELSEFMVFCGDLMADGRSEESEQLYRALLKSLPEKSRIMQGYAMTCIMNGQASKGLNLIKEMWAQFPATKSEDMIIITLQLRRKSMEEDELAVLEFITREFPDSGLAHFWLADAQEYYGNIEEAFKNCTKVLELNPEFEDAVEMRRRLELKLKITAPCCQRTGNICFLPVKDPATATFTG